MKWVAFFIIGVLLIFLGFSGWNAKRSQFDYDKYDLDYLHRIEVPEGQESKPMPDGYLDRG